MNNVENLNIKLATILANQKLVSKERLRFALDECKSEKKNLGQFLVQKKIISLSIYASAIQSIKTLESNNATLLQVPKKIGQYTIVDELARGGMGVVYRAKSGKLNRIVVLKTLINQNNSIQAKRFLKEAQAIASLNHPNIVELYDYGEQNGFPYFTMQYIKGVDFEEYISQEINNGECIKILIKIAHALHYAHQQGIVHRDIKPSNILLDENKTPYLADFGLAKTQNKLSPLTRTGCPIGTPFFLSPEQAKGDKKKINRSTDIYALGVILYKILTKKYPFSSNNLSLLLKKIQYDIPLSPKEINSEIPDKLNFLCLKAIEKKIEHRYTTALEFANYLEEYIENPSDQIDSQIALLYAKN